MKKIKKTNKIASFGVIAQLGIILLLAHYSSSGQTQQICSISTIPTNWVVTEIKTNATRCITKTDSTEYTITKITTQTKITICKITMPMPFGWVITGIKKGCNCCGKIKKTGIEYTLQNISDFKFKDEVEIFCKDNIPPNWVIVKIDNTKSSWTIKNLNLKKL